MPKHLSCKRQKRKRKKKLIENFNHGMRNIFNLPLDIPTTTLSFGISDFGYMQSSIYSEKHAIHICQIDLHFITCDPITIKCQTSNTCYTHIRNIFE